MDAYNAEDADNNYADADNTEAADAEHGLDDYFVDADVNAAADCTSYLPLSWNLSPFLNQRTLTFSLFIPSKSELTDSARIIEELPLFSEVIAQNERESYLGG